MSRRLVILTEIIAPYRIPVFNALAQQEGIDLHVIFLAETDPALRQWLIYKDDIRFSYEVLSSWRRRVGGYNLLLNWGLGPVLQRASPNAILCGGYNYLASWQTVWWARRNRVPLLVWVESTARDMRNGHAPVEFLKRTFLRRCDAFVVPGKSSLEYLRTHQVPDESIFTAPNAVDIDFFCRCVQPVRADTAGYRLALNLPSRFFLFVGRLVAEKGVFDLLEAYRTLTPELRTDVGLVFVGEGAARPELSRHAASIQPGKVQFAGFAQREDLAAYYALAEVLILPTYTDTWGLVVNEAMACDLPIICSSAAGCVADLVEDGWNGRVVAPGAVVDLASAMDQLARSPDTQGRMGARSRQRILQYSPQACAAGIAGAVLSL